MTFSTKLLLALGVVLVGAVWLWDHDRQVAQRALFEQRDRARGDSIAVLVREAERLERAYRVDTVRLRFTLTRWDTIKAGLDTLRDTVRVPVEVVRIVQAAADSVIQACREALRTCEERVAVERQRGDLFERRFTDLKDQSPSWFRRRASVTIGYGVVRTPDGIVHAGPALSVGVRVWPY